MQYITMYVTYTSVCPWVVLRFPSSRHLALTGICVLYFSTYEILSYTLQRFVIYSQLSDKQIKNEATYFPRLGESDTLGHEEALFRTGTLFTTGFFGSLSHARPIDLCKTLARSFSPSLRTHPVAPVWRFSCDGMIWCDARHTLSIVQSARSSGRQAVLLCLIFHNAV